MQILHISYILGTFADVKTYIYMDENSQIMVVNRLKAVLADKQKTCKWLANELGKSENTVYRWTAKRMQPSLQQLYEAAEILDVYIR